MAARKIPTRSKSAAPLRRARKVAAPGRTAAARRARAGRAAAAPADAAALAVLEQFRVIFRSTKKHFQWIEAATGVSGAQLWLLAELQRAPGIRVTELARALAVHQSTASNLLERLEERGLIQRARSPQDARNVLLSLTAAGRDVIARAPMPLEGVLPNALRALPLTQLAQLQVLLDGVVRRLKVRDRGGRRVPLAEM